MTITGVDAKHIGKVLRMQPGDKLQIVSDDGVSALAEVVAITEDAAVEKHVPYTSIEDDDVLYVKIGEVDHPMTEDHYITWVAAVYNDSVLKYNFKPGEVPEAVFDYEEGMVVYAYCNLHGLWKKEL